MVTGGFKRLATLGEGGVKFVGALDGGAQDRRSEAVELAAARVGDEKALGGESSRVEIGERLSEGAAGLVSGGESIGRFGWAEDLGGAVYERQDGIVEHHAAGGKGGFGRFAVGKLSQLAAGGKRDVIDLGEIVVLAGEPENGGMRMTCSGGLAGASNGGCGFERREERTAEEADLLAGENGSGAHGECRQRVFGVGGWVLHGEEVNELRPMRGERRAFLFRAMRRKKGAERAGAKIHKETALPRRHAYGITFCGQ